MQPGMRCPSNKGCKVHTISNRIGERTGEAEALRQAYGEVYRFVQQQASVLAYIDTFWILGGFCLAALVFFAKKTKPGQR
jgi:hypothetical protein